MCVHPRTTISSGSTSCDACVTDYFIADEDHMLNDKNPEALGYETTCHEDTQGNSSACCTCHSEMRCTGEGLTLVEVALKGGSWRYGPFSAQVLECPTPDACAGGNYSNKALLLAREGSITAAANTLW